MVLFTIGAVLVIVAVLLLGYLLCREIGALRDVHAVRNLGRVIGQHVRNRRADEIHRMFCPEEYDTPHFTRRTVRG